MIPAKLRLPFLLVAMLALALSHRAAAQADTIAQRWWQNASTFQSKHYDVRCDMPRALANELAAHMDRMFENYGNVLAGLRPRRSLRLNLLLFESQQDYLATISSRFDLEVMGTGGVCIKDGGKVILAVWHGNRSPVQLKAVLQHEGFHQIARSLLGDIPHWADEGLAQFFESAVVLDDRLFFGEAPAPWINALRQAEQRGTLLPLTKLLQTDGEDWNEAVNAGRAQLLYLQAWSFIHFLAFGEVGRRGGDPDAIDRFMSELNTGMAWESAFLRAFGTNDFKALNDQWRNYVRHLQPTDLHETMQRLDFLAAGMLALRGRGQQSESFEDLRAALVECGFTHPCKLFEPPVSIKASEAPSFLIPYSLGSEGGSIDASFVLVAMKDKTADGKAKKTPSRERTRPRRDDSKGKGESQPAPAATPEVSLGPPPMIATQGLRPFDLQVTWASDKQSGEWRYRIDIRR